MFRALISILLVCLPLANWASDAEPDTDYQPVRSPHALETVLPPEVRYLHMESPRIVYQVIVDPSGKASDYLAVEATHFGLLEKGEQKLLKSEFVPAMKDGKPVTGKITIVITFFDPELRAWKRGIGTVQMGSSVSEAAERRMYQISKANFVYKETMPEDLDKPLQLLESKLCLVHEPDQPMAKGRVVVEYYVDHKGKPRLPKIIQSEGESLSLSALMTLENTRFAPPLKDGRPTYVLVRQPFNFD